MNILPKKRWHVRTKENIARVRKDEALAAEQAKLEQARIDKAESEARLNFLRNESRKKNRDIQETYAPREQNLGSNASTSTNSKHINFFEELEQGSIDYTKSNKDYEKEKKEEQEKYEKQIGLLTYLGQGCKEDVSKRWYNELPKRIDDTESNIEFKPNKKSVEDPMQDIKRYLKMMSTQKSSNKPVVKCENKKSSFNSNIKDNYSKSNKQKRESTLENESSEDEYRSKKKHKKHKKHKKLKNHKKSKDKEPSQSKSYLDIEKLRAERLEREKQERLKTQALLAELRNKGDLEANGSKSQFKQKYNSQFFPELARQNNEKIYTNTKSF
ncbi:leukocyte receptor cluster member 1 homolog [Phymastichus coffea]|uniref:leukocyte receptor cluster member 1 homolog n=1 Tax=Phymastichus coffea TaxID=108790 RepID=UPI00273A8D0A|nr:leukocyte receptor cluster member 1 homolog [Phymastichus coffea]